MGDEGRPAPAHVDRHGEEGEAHHAALVVEEVLVGGNDVQVQLLLGVGRDEGALELGDRHDLPLLLGQLVVLRRFAGGEGALVRGGALLARGA